MLGQKLSLKQPPKRLGWEQELPAQPKAAAIDAELLENVSEAPLGPGSYIFSHTPRK